MPIKFGTSGWRGLISDEVTFTNVRRCAAAIARYVTQHRAPATRPLLVLGYDTRFLGRPFGVACAEIVSRHGLKVLLANRDCPTPALAWQIREKKAAGGINITASHNPPEYSGVKFSGPDGAPAPPEVTQIIESLVPENSPPVANHATVSPLEEFDPRPGYFRQVRRIVDFKLLHRGRQRVVVDPMHGSGRGYLDALLAEAGWQVESLHDNPDPLFGGHPPEPVAEHLHELAVRVKKFRARLGLALDGDADRYGIMDADGRIFTANQILALTLYHLAKNRGWKGSAVRTVVTSHMIDRVAEMFGVKIHETPVGFKYVGSIMQREPVIVGGEESNGLSVLGHVPEKDGIVACLLMAELIAVEKKSVGALLKELEKKIGAFHTERINARLTEERKESFLARVSKGMDSFAGKKVVRHITADGNKFVLDDGSWVAFRASGTEPVVRCYIEAHSKSECVKLRRAIESLLKQEHSS
jgi:phosphoglucomutase